MSLYKGEYNKTSFEEIKTNDIIGYKNEDGHKVSGKVVEVKEEIHKPFTFKGCEFSGYKEITVKVRTAHGPELDTLTNRNNLIYREVK
jgi:hypothetical protein